LFLISLGLLIGTVVLVIAEQQWAKPQLRDDLRTVFMEGSTGTEFVPVVVLQVMPGMFPDYFQPKGLTKGDWIAQYGFIRNPQGDSSLPLGMTLSHYRPRSAAPSPIPFAGFSCGACHSQEIQIERNGPRHVVIGAGNNRLNLLAFGEAFRGALMAHEDGDRSKPYRLRMETIEQAHRMKEKELSFAEKAMTTLWLNAVRNEESKFQIQVDEPFRHDQIFDPAFVPAGPSRTQPFRSLVRIVADRPGTDETAHLPDAGYSKIPVVYHQHEDYHGTWAQFDGSIKNYIARSALAASTAGATVDNLAHPEIAHNIIKSAQYTLRLAPATWNDVPMLKELPPDPTAVTRGARVYQDHCYRCHGGPGESPGTWTYRGAADFGKILDVGTDLRRVTFRHKERMPRLLFDRFNQTRKKHPLAFAEDDLRAPKELGYYCGPIGGIVTRAPYLHNSSVLTIAELINLRPTLPETEFPNNQETHPRRPVFYRGNNLFDPVNIGLRAPRQKDDEHYFRFDTGERGNSNKGHDFPWPYQGTGWNERDLKDLLEYLKTI
jgi:hypothetical protein